MITSSSFKSIEQVDSITNLMHETCTLALFSPIGIYRFMLRFVCYCRGYSFLVARLAGIIGSSYLFQDPSCPYVLHAERSMDVAANVLSAAIEEFKDGKIGVSHRTMSYGLLDKLAEYTKLTKAEMQQIAQSETWLDEILQEVDRGYNANAEDLSSMVKAMGFHVGAETVGTNESSTIYDVFFAQQRGSEFDKFMRQHKLSFAGGNISPSYWVAVHGTHHSVGVEADHAKDALKALNQVVQYGDASEAQVIAWADEGFAHFNRVQTAFFQAMKQELQRELQQQNLIVKVVA